MSGSVSPVGLHRQPRVVGERAGLARAVDLDRRAERQRAGRGSRRSTCSRRCRSSGRPGRCRRVAGVEVDEVRRALAAVGVASARRDGRARCRRAPSWARPRREQRRRAAAVMAAAMIAGACCMKAPTIAARGNLRLLALHACRSPVRHQDAARAAARGDRRQARRGARPRRVHPRPGGRRRSRREFAAYLGARARRRRRQRHRRAHDRAARARRRPRRRRRRPLVHVLRLRRGDPVNAARARCSATSTRRRSA